VPYPLGTTVSAAAGPWMFRVLRILASGSTNLDQTNALVWVMIGIATAGAIVTFAFLTYSLWKFRDPKVKDRPYG